MIKTKTQYKYFVREDKKALGINKRFPCIIGDEIWKFELALRKAEYLLNCKPLFWKARFFFVRYRKHVLAMKCGGFSIPYNVFQEGLAIVHWGSVVVSDGAEVGRNCRIHEGVTIGATNGQERAASIGDNCFLGTGAKVIGKISIGNNVAVGAGAVVVKPVPDNVTVGGVPAKKISDSSSLKNMPNILK